MIIDDLRAAIERHPGGHEDLERRLGWKPGDIGRNLGDLSLLNLCQNLEALAEVLGLKMSLEQVEASEQASSMAMGPSHREHMDFPYTEPQPGAEDLRVTSNIREAVTRFGELHPWPHFAASKLLNALVRAVVALERAVFEGEVRLVDFQAVLVIAKIRLERVATWLDRYR